MSECGHGHLPLHNKVCLVTGASRGIGRVIAETFAAKGAIVYANGRVDGSLEDWINDYNLKVEGQLISSYFDVTDQKSVKAAIMTIRREQGRIDVLVNNAGVEKDEAIGMITRESMNRMFDVNVYGVIDLLQLAARVMMSKGSGSIINIASIVGDKGNPGQLVYSATKGAVIALTKTAAKELGPKGIRVNAVAPGLTETDMIEPSGKAIEKRLSQIKLGRIGQPQDVAGVCAFLASDEGAYVSGQVISVDGCSII